jgi:hypothetical protein
MPRPPAFTMHLVSRRLAPEVRPFLPALTHLRQTSGGAEPVALYRDSCCWNLRCCKSGAHPSQPMAGWPGRAGGLSRAGTVCAPRCVRNIWHHHSSGESRCISHGSVDHVGHQQRRYGSSAPRHALEFLCRWFTSGWITLCDSAIPSNSRAERRASSSSVADVPHASKPCRTTPSSVPTPSLHPPS